jgi:hypothetical protein
LAPTQAKLHKGVIILSQSGVFPRHSVTTKGASMVAKSEQSSANHVPLKYDTVKANLSRVRTRLVTFIWNRGLN